MGSFETETVNNVDLDVYLSLGIRQRSKGVTKIPRVLSLLSLLFEKSVERNEAQLTETNGRDVLTIFHGVRPPTLSVRQYVHRIFKYSCCSPSCFVIANIYVDRFLNNTDAHLTSLNVHRLVITSVMLAAKFMDDAFFNNAYYARVGGLSTGELNRLEMKFLFGIDFRLQVNVETFGRYCLKLEEESAKGLDQIERPMKACRIKEGLPKKDDSAYAPPVAR